jgi:hypothetical protein
MKESERVGDGMKVIRGMKKKKNYKKPRVDTRRVSFMMNTVSSSPIEYGPHREAPRRQ